jgi:DNA-binding phage protein
VAGAAEVPDAELPGGALVSQLRVVANELRLQVDNFDLETMTRELLGRIAGPELNLDGLDPTLKLYVTEMPPKAWQALQQHAQAAGGVGITSVRLGPELSSGGQRLVDVLKELPTLKRLFIAAPTSGKCIDFGCLQRTEHQEDGIQLEKVILRGDAPRGLWLKVPVGVTVEAQGQSRPGLWNSLVFYTDPEGNVVGGSHPVHGQIHASDAAEFRQPGIFSRDDPQVRAEAIRLNLRALMDNGELAVCRRLTGQLLNDLMADKPLSLKPYATEAGISGHVLPSVDSDLQRMVAQGSCALYTPDKFGAMAAEKFNGMQVGGSRLFAVSTGSHLLGLQLLVIANSQGGVMQRIVKLYDPTYTAKLEVLPLVGDDLSPLRSKSLADFCVGKQDVLAYFGDGKYSVGSLFHWPPGPAREQGNAVQVSVHVSQEDLATAGFLYAALEDGHVELVRASLAALRAQGIGMDKSELAAKAGDPSMPGLYRAVSTGSPPDVVEEYVKQVLDFPPRLLSSASKFSLFRAEHRGKTVLHCSVELGRTDTVLPFVRAANALTRGERYKLLLSPTSLGQPMLSELCAAHHPLPHTEDQAYQAEAIHVYLKEIVNSQVLSDSEKEALVSANDGNPGSELPAAKLALNSGNPGAAAAMLLAILDCEASPALKTRLHIALGVTADEVLAGFAQTQFDKATQGWMLSTILRIKAHQGSLPG